MDLRARLGPVHEQGERPTCLAFAVTAAHELSRAESVVEEDLSEEALYWGCKKLDGGVPTGTSFTAARGALGSWGQPAEVIWPYDPRRDESLPYRPPRGVTAGGREWHRAPLARVRHSVASLRTVLASGRIVAVGLLLTQGFYNPLANWIPVPTAGEATLGAHAVALVGYDDDDSGAGHAGFLVRNSWGDAWADRGYAWLPYSYVQKLGREAWLVQGGALSAPN